jgi:hypothetical protein
LRYEQYAVEGQTLSDVSRIRLQAVARLRVFLSKSMNPPSDPDPIALETRRAMYQEIKTQIEQVVIGLTIDREDTKPMKKVQALLSDTYEEWIQKDQVTQIDDIMQAIDITSTQADMLVELTHDHSFWYTIAQQLGGAFVGIAIIALFQYVSNSDFLNLVPYMIALTAVAGVQWVTSSSIDIYAQQPRKKSRICVSEHRRLGDIFKTKQCSGLV